MSIAYIVTDLGFGDAGKGTITASLCQHKEIDLVVRFNGGAQASHTVVSNNILHKFHTYGSGTLEKIPTLLTSNVLIDPIILFVEKRELLSKIPDFDFKNSIYIDPECLVTTYFHKVVNRAREASRENKHGSCGLGIGTTMEFANSNSDALRVKDFFGTKAALREKLLILEKWALEELNRIPNSQEFIDINEIENEITDIEEIYPAILSRFTIEKSEDVINRFPSGSFVFEGAQGVLLDENFGFYPYVTYSTTTSSNAIKLLESSNFKGTIHKVGVIRAYQTRHGEGPFPTEDSDLLLNDVNNPENEWQGKFRVGHLDLVLTSYAIKANGGIDSLAITCLDQVQDLETKLCLAYSEKVTLELPNSKEEAESIGRKLFEVVPYYLTLNETEDLVEKISEILEVPISILSYSSSTEDKVVKL